MKIYDGDVISRTDLAEKEYKKNRNCYFNHEMKSYAEKIKNIATTYKNEGWKAIVNLIKEVNLRCWEANWCGEEHVSEFYAELYHAACAWYMGYPANKYEKDNCNEGDGSYDHVSEDDLCAIYKALD